jgi:hypothetical protein
MKLIKVLSVVVVAARERIARVQRQTGKYSELEHQKEQVAAQEDADKVLSAKIDIKDLLGSPM